MQWIDMETPQLAQGSRSSYWAGLRSDPFQVRWPLSILWAAEA